MLCLLTYLLMKKLKKTFVLVLFFCLAIPVNRAQNIYINFKDGSHAQYALTDIRSILVAGDTMTLNKTDGSTLAWPESSIGNYNYKGILYGITEPETEFLLDATVYPNPGKGPFTIRYQLLKNSRVTVDIMDIQGKKDPATESRIPVNGNEQSCMGWTGREQECYRLRNLSL